MPPRPSRARKTIDAEADEETADDDRRQAVESSKVAAVAPMFAEAGGSTDFDHITVHRLEPVEEGFLGKIDVGTSEDALRARFGGGKYRLYLRTTRGGIKSNKVIVLAGDPVLQSDDARAKYRRSLGLSAVEEKEQVPQIPQQAAPAVPAMGEMLTLFTTFQQMQANADAKRAEQQARADEQRRRDDDAREERRRKDEESARQRDREHQTQMLQLITQIAAAPGRAAAEPQANLLEAFTSGMKTAMSMQPAAPPAPKADDDDDDEGRGRGPAGASGADTAAMVQAAVRGIVDAAASKFGAGGAPSAPVQQALPPVPEDPNEVKVRGKLGAQMQQFAEVAKKHGQDPSVVLARAMSSLQEQIITGAAARAAAAPAPAEQPASAPAEQPAEKGQVAANAIAEAAARMKQHRRNGVAAPTA